MTSWSFDVVHSYLEVYGETSELKSRNAQKVGFAFLVLMQSRARALDLQNYFASIIQPAVSFEQIRFFFDDEGNPVAYVVWALVSDDVMARLISKPKVGLHLSEWCEGPNLWILDLVVAPERLRYVLKHCRDDVFQKFQMATYSKQKVKRLLFKRIMRDVKYSFFKNAK